MRESKGHFAGGCLIAATCVLMLFSILLIPSALAFPEKLDASDPALNIYFDEVLGANLGWRSGDKAGSAFASGDLDGDGLEDLVIGSPFGVSEVDTRVDSGVVSVILGTTLAKLNGTLDLTAADCRIFGNVSGQLLGSSLATADINDDGLDDIIVGSPGYGTPVPGQAETTEQESYMGAFFVIPGRPAAQFPSFSNITAVSKFYVLGTSRNQQIGKEVESGDLNGDGISDIIVSAIEKDPLTTTGRWGGTGKVYVFYGGSELPAGSAGTENADIRIIGASQGEGTGYSLACGDTNRDGFDDLFIGAPYYAPYLVARETGRIFGVFGSKDLGTIINLTDAGLVITGDETESQFGRSLACGDFDKDGTADLAASAPTLEAGPRENAGMVYIFQGGPGLRDDMNPRMNYFSYTGGASGDHAGDSLSFLDFAGGRTYLSVGCPQSNGSGYEGFLRGKLFLLECRTGRPTGASTLPESSEHILYGEADGDLFGTASGSILIGGAGGSHRLLAGSPEADGPDGARPNAGTVYVFRQVPKPTGGAGGGTGPQDPGAGEDVDVPQGFTWRQGAVFFILVLVVFLLFVGFQFHRFRRSHSGGGADDQGGRVENQKDKGDRYQ